MTTSTDHEVLIIGGGPAGSTLGALLSMRGRRALVIEREEFPRFHIGESLLPMSCEIFDKLELSHRLDDRYLRKYGAKFVCSRTGRENTYLFSESFDNRYPYAYQVPRADFDHLLLIRAVELGTSLKQPCKVAEVMFEDTVNGRSGAPPRPRAVGVRLEDGSELRAPIVVDASGRGSMLASRFRAKRRLQGLDQSAVFAHYKGLKRDSGQAGGHIRIVIFEHGWIWLIPFRGEVTSVGMVVSRDWMNQRQKGEELDNFLDRSLALAPFMNEVLADAERISPVRSTADFSYGVSEYAGDGWMCVGDACGFIDPLFSTGAHLAIKGADLAAQAIDEALKQGDTSRPAFADYEEQMRKASGLFLGIVQAFYDGEFREMLFESPQRRTLRQVITSMLGGDVVHNGRTPTWVRFVRGRFPARYD